MSDVWRRGHGKAKLMTRPTERPLVMSRLARWASRAAIVVSLTLRAGTVPPWRLSPQPPPAMVLPVGDPVIPIDRRR